MAVRSFQLTDARVEARDDDTAALAFSGYASVFDALSEDLGGFRERFAAEAFNRTLAHAADVRFLVNHDPGQVLARTTAGTLRLSTDEHGLRTVADMAPVSYARDLRVLLERGDVDQMSIGFRAVDDTWEHDEDGALIRTVREAQLFDVSTVAFPAYTQTSAEARSLIGRLEQLTDTPDVDADAVRSAIEQLGGQANADDRNVENMGRPHVAARSRRLDLIVDAFTGEPVKF